MSANWNPPSNWQKITSIDAHTAGEPLRVITGGLAPIPGKSILEKRRYAQERLDTIRRALMWEPRGHADMYGCIITEPVTEDGTLGVLFLHNDGFSTMCGHGIIGLATVAVETGMVASTGEETVIRMDTPAGRVTATVHCRGGRVQEVSFENVPSFAYALDQQIEISGLGSVQYDIGFGGAYYAFVQSNELGLRLDASGFRQIIAAGKQIKKAISGSIEINHPYEDDLGFLYGTIFVGPAEDPSNHSRNVCVFADGEVDRCPTGTGVSARAALHYARTELELKETFIVESILGTTFAGEIVKEVNFESYQAVIPKVTGSSYITGRNELLLDPLDPLKDGFILR